MSKISINPMNMSEMSVKDLAAPVTLGAKERKLSNVEQFSLDMDPKTQASTNITLGNSKLSQN